MKTYDDCKKARDFLITQLERKDLDRTQVALMCGLSVALQWVCDEGGNTLQDMLDGVPIEGAMPGSN